MSELAARVENMDEKVHDVRQEISNLRVEVANIKGQLPYLATKADVASSRNTIIVWLIVLFLGTGLFNHFFNTNLIKYQKNNVDIPQKNN